MKKAIFLVFLALGLIGLAEARTTFVFSSAGGSWNSVGTYGSVGVHQQGSGYYGGAWGGGNVRGGWSTTGGSGSFGYHDGIGLTSVAVSSPGGVRGSWVLGNGNSGYGSFTVGNPRFAGGLGGWGAAGARAYGYPQGVAYPGSYGQWGAGW